MLVSLSAEKTALFLRQTERLFSVYKGLCWNTDKGGRAAYFQRVNHHDITMNNKETKVNVSIPHVQNGWVQNGWVQNGWVQNGWVQNGWPDSRNGHILSTSYNSCKHLDVLSLGLHFFPASDVLVTPFRQNGACWVIRIDLSHALYCFYCVRRFSRPWKLFLERFMTILLK